MKMLQGMPRFGRHHVGWFSFQLSSGFAMQMCLFMVAMNVSLSESLPPATPAECKDDVKGAINLNLDWIADTGSAQDLVNDSELPDDYGYYSDNPIRMITANGESSSSKQGRVFVPKLGKTDPYLVRSSPPVISVGMRCVEDGYDFVWRGSKGEPPYMVKPNGERIELVVRDYVPYFANKSKTISTPSTQPRPSIATPASEEDQQSPEPDGEIEIISDEPIDVPSPSQCCLRRLRILMPTGRLSRLSTRNPRVAAVVFTRIKMISKDHLARKL